MDRPRIADLFCGAGGAAKGLQRAGFHVVGFDIKPQPRYAGDEFHQADALTVDLSGFDAVWASPPCQYYSRLRHLPWLKDRSYWRSIPPTREHVQKWDIPYIIENVEDARWDMCEPVTLCGEMFGLSLFRHRRFECSWFQLMPPHIKHTKTIAPGHASLSERGNGMQGFKEINRDSIAGHGRRGDVGKWSAVMGIDWMTGAELAQAVPPAYAEYLGEHLIARVGAETGVS